MTSIQKKRFIVNNYLLQSITETTSILYKNRKLTFALAKRELLDPCAGQLLGGMWAFIHPIFLILVYLFIFGIVFKRKIGGTHELPMDYITYILSGMIPWLSFQVNLGKTAGAILGNANLVQQVVFPIEILPVKAVLATLASQLFSLLILLAYVLFAYNRYPLSYVLLPILLMLQTLLSIGLGFVLASLSVYIKDIKDFVALICTASIYFMPIVYLPAWVPSMFKPLMYINPFSYMIWCYQDALYFGRIEHPYAWGVFFTTTILFYFLGCYCFNTLKHGFGDAL